MSKKFARRTAIMVAAAMSLSTAVVAQPTQTTTLTSESLRTTKSEPTSGSALETEPILITSDKALGTPAEQLQNALDNIKADATTPTVIYVEEGLEIKLESELQINKNVEIIGLGDDGSKPAITNRTIFIGTTANVTLKNLTFKDLVEVKDNDETCNNISAKGFSSTLIIDGCTFEPTIFEAIIVTPTTGANIQVKNCKFITNEDNTVQKRFIQIQAQISGSFSASLTTPDATGVLQKDGVEVTTSNVFDLGLPAEALQNGMKVQITNNTFTNIHKLLKSGGISITNINYSDINVGNNKFEVEEGFSVSSKLQVGYFIPCKNFGCMDGTTCENGEFGHNLFEYLDGDVVEANMEATINDGEEWKKVNASIDNGEGGEDNGNGEGGEDNGNGEGGEDNGNGEGGEDNGNGEGGEDNGNGEGGEDNGNGGNNGNEDDDDDYYDDYTTAEDEDTSSTGSSSSGSSSSSGGGASSSTTTTTPEVETPSTEDSTEVVDSSEIQKELDLATAEKLAGEVSEVTQKVIDAFGNKSFNHKATALKDTGLVINGKKVELKDSILAENGRTMLPIRTIAEALGLEIAYNAQSKVAVVVKDGMTIEFVLGTNTAIVNGKDLVQIDANNPDVKIIAENGRTYLPVRFIAEQFGLSVDYDYTNKTINITQKN